MMKCKCMFFSVVYALFILSSVANALPILVGDTDDLIGGSQSQPHQDNLDNVNWLVNEYNANTDPDLPYPLVLLGKWEVDESDWEGANPGFTGDFLGNSGDWAAPSGWTSPIYYSIKAGNQNSNPPGGFELYYADGDLSASWSTVGLGEHNLSHISFWTAESAPTPAPEPATMLLFGTGLFALAVARLKRKK